MSKAGLLEECERLDGLVSLAERVQEALASECSRRGERIVELDRELQNLKRGGG